MKHASIILILKKSFWIWHDYLGMLILLNILWWLSALSIIAAPPFTAAICFVADKMVHDEPVRWRHVLNGFLRFFGRGWLAVGLMGLLYLILTANYFFYRQFQGGLSLFGAFWVGICIWINLIYLLQQLYLLPIIAHGDLSFWQGLKKSFLLMLDNPKTTLIMGGILTIFFLLSTISGIAPALFSISASIVIAAMTTKETLRRYRPDCYPTAPEEEETRSIKHLIRPWEN
ncbi:MAG: hypothetical protein B6244_13580 [Candidatus Cloacimonetes bacterium 4572_55]|nr:MAG: hypothetical protein B6244_13580 [Candidatus Cloacimonetes bacterium 4572_55]